MTREAIIEAIRVVLRDRLGNTRLATFDQAARLNEDLHLDSILMLQLFLNLELEHGLVASEEALGARAIETVRDLADLFDPDAPAPAALAPETAPSEGVHGEDYYDVKVHCFVSCLCAGLKHAGIDHRPFYFGVWDADFAITERHALRYHHETVRHDDFRLWFQRLYGVDLVEWYDLALPKHDNVARLVDLVETRRPSEAVMVMLDLHHLPERENKFNQNPFPHYLMLEITPDPDVWMVLDPDFRWEGGIARDRILNAVSQPTVAGGYVFDRAQARAADRRDVVDYFDACFRPRNPLVEAMREIVAAHLDGAGGVGLADLPGALAELPVISIRKYAYEHGFAYVWRALKLPSEEFDVWCEEIDALFQGIKRAHYAALRLSETGDRSLAPDLLADIDRLDALESRIKRRLGDAFAELRSTLDAAPRGRFAGVEA